MQGPATKPNQPAEPRAAPEQSSKANAAEKKEETPTPKDMQLRLSMRGRLSKAPRRKASAELGSKTTDLRDCEPERGECLGKYKRK